MANGGGGGGGAGEEGRVNESRRVAEVAQGSSGGGSCASWTDHHLCVTNSGKVKEAKTLFKSFYFYFEISFYFSSTGYTYTLIYPWERTWRRGKNEKTNCLDYLLDPKAKLKPMMGFFFWSTRMVYYYQVLILLSLYEPCCTFIWF